MEEIPASSSSGFPPFKDQTRPSPPAKLGRIVVIPPEDWSAEGHVAYDQASLAGEDTEREAAINLKETGEVVNFGDGAVIKVLEIRERVYGPA